MNFKPTLKRFSRRVRLLRAWIGLGVGLTIGGAFAALWATLDWLNIVYAEWSYLGWLVGICGVLGILFGALRRISPKSLADSIDRRAGLQNRLGTASERSETHGTFDDALRVDASERLEALKPASLYPIKVSRWHAGAIALSILAASVFLLGNTPLLMSEAAKKNREELQKKAAEVEHVMKPLENEAEKGRLNPDEKKLAEELKKLSNDLHKARIDPAEAMRRQNELNKEAEKLSESRFDKADKDLQTAQSMLDQMKQAQLEKMEGQLEQNDMSKPGEQDPGQQNNGKLSPDEMKQLQQASDLQQQIASVKDQLEDTNLSKEAREALKDKLTELQKELANMKLSKKVQDMLDRMMKDPLWKQIQELAAKLAKAKAAAAKGGQQGGKRGQLTKEQVEQMMKNMEALADQLKDPKAMHAYLQALLDALKNGQIGQSLNPGVGLFGIPMPGAGLPSRDLYFANTGKIFTGKGEKSRGQTEAVGVTGQSREVPGQEAYIELRGPTTNGLRSSIPYQKVLPSYKHKADEAINRQEIPPEQQQRVKKYFESLGQ